MIYLLCSEHPAGGINSLRNEIRKTPFIGNRNPCGVGFIKFQCRCVHRSTNLTAFARVSLQAETYPIEL